MECGPYSLDLDDYYAPGVTTDELVTRSLATLRSNYADGSIDDTDNLRNSAIYIVGGTEDTTMPMLAVEGTDEVYTTMGVSKIDFQKLPIHHDPLGSRPIDGIKYIYTELGYAPDGFNDPATDAMAYGEMT